jgi:hypothetical protein
MANLYDERNRSLNMAGFPSPRPAGNPGGRPIRLPIAAGAQATRKSRVWFGKISLVKTAPDSLDLKVVVLIPGDC